jgi:hypothetical protein
MRGLLFVVLVLLSAPAGAAIYSYNCGGFPLDTDVTLSADIRSNDAADVFRLSSVKKIERFQSEQYFDMFTLIRLMLLVTRMYVNPIASVAVPSVVGMTCFPVVNQWMYGLLGLAGILAGFMIYKGFMVFFQGR